MPFLSTSLRLLIQCSESTDVLLNYQSDEGTAQRNASTCGSRKLHLQGICCHRFCQARLRAGSDTVLSLLNSNVKVAFDRVGDGIFIQTRNNADLFNVVQGLAPCLYGGTSKSNNERILEGQDHECGESLPCRTTINA